MITSAQISDQIAALDRAMIEFEAEAERLSLGAVSGNPQAIDALATVHGKIAQAATDRTVLISARAAASKIENASKAADADAERAAAMEQARDNAGKILAAARRVDAIAGEFRALLMKLTNGERAIWAALRKAGQTPGGGIIGQQGIADLAVDAMVNASRPVAFRPQSITARAEAAWGDLLEGEAK